MRRVVGSFAVGLDESISTPALVKQRQSVRLGPALDQSMTTPAALAYRQAYQRHRAGLPTGASGERPEEAEEEEVTDILGKLLVDDSAADESYHGGVYGSHEMNRNESGFSSLLQWRLSYQAHRSGAAAGAKGEVGAGLTVEDVRQLPVAELAAHLHQLKLRAGAARPSASSAADDDAEKPVHVHVGAGRLGLGLVVPALARASRDNGGTLVLLQRPSDAWAALGHGTDATLSVRSAEHSECVCRLRVVREGVEGALAAVAAQRAAAPSAAAADERIGLLILTEAPEELDALAAQATSLSCSLGPALETGMAPLLAALSRAQPPPSGAAGEGGAAGGGAADGMRLYAGENDHDAVARLAATPAVTSLGLRVAPLLVDRVCTDRVISAAGVETVAEAWGGEIVVMPTVHPPKADAPDAPQPADGGAAAAAAPPPDSKTLARRRLLAVPPFRGAGVRWPSSAAEAHFLHRRKILTVNGTHTTLAFLTLSLHEPPPKVGLPSGDYELLRALPRDGGGMATAGSGDSDELLRAMAREEAGVGSAGESGDDDDDDQLQVEETHRQTWCWAVARQLLLLFECSEEVAVAALKAERETAAATHKALADALLEGARIAIRRLGKGGDTTKRILGGGVVNRFQTRLQPVASFLAPAAPRGAAAGAGSAAGGAPPGSKWIRGALPRLLMRRARLTETAMRLAVLGLATDAERFTISTSMPASRAASPSRRGAPPSSPARPKREMPAVPRAPAASPKAPTASPKATEPRAAGGGGFVLPPSAAADGSVAVT